MSSHLRWVLLLLSMLGCATEQPFELSSPEVVFAVEQVGPRSFLIACKERGRASESQVVDFGLARACQVARQHGFDYFALIDLAHSTSEEVVYGSDSSLAADTRHGLVIEGFPSRPKRIFVFEVSHLEDVLREKYERVLPVLGS